MCGIVGYVGSRRAEDVLLEGLRRLEYRGYDSAGIATADGNVIRVVKAVGRVVHLSDALSRQPLAGTVGVAHTRWATHGEPTNENAHPHVDCQGNIAVVHNGIIENYAELKHELVGRGHHFRSETDTEVVAHLIEENMQSLSFSDAFFAALSRLTGTFGIAAICGAEPKSILVARRGSPIVLGLGAKRDEFFVASDPSAILSYTRDVIYLDDDEAAVISGDGIETFSLAKARKEKEIETLNWSLSEIERGNFPHFMIKEIFEQAETVRAATRGRLDLAEGRAVLGGLRDLEGRLRDIERLTIVGCGSARLSGAIGECMLEEYADIPTEVETASEYRYRKPVIDPRHEAVIAVSQSGETADTLGALREAKSKGALVLGVVNVVGSTIARETDAGVFTHAGPEIAVASTKAFVAQTVVFSLLALHFGRSRRMSLATGQRIVEELLALPEKIERILKENDRIKALAKKYAHYSSAMYVGRKYNAPIAFEGALKLKEVAYVHAEGFAAGEMKHGPIALLDPMFPVIAVVTKDSVYEKVRSNLEEAKARRAPILAIANEGDEDIHRITEDVIRVPRTIEMLSPILNVIPLQLFAYHVAVARGLDPDKPRNLAKSVTVE